MTRLKERHESVTPEIQSIDLNRLFLENGGLPARSNSQMLIPLAQLPRDRSRFEKSLASTAALIPMRVSTDQIDRYRVRKSAGLPVRVSRVPEQTLRREVTPLPTQSVGRERSIPSVQGTLTNAGRHPAFAAVGETNIAVPLDGQTHVNVATIKALAGRPRDTMLRRVGDRWEPVSDDHQVNLLGRTEYRLGSVTIYS